MRVSGVGVGVDCECLEGVVDMCSQDQTADHGLLRQEKLDVAS